MKNFIWGVATASYQIEGAWDKDDKEENIWDHYCHTIRDKLNGDTACDFYHKYPEDIQLAKECGFRALRILNASLKHKNTTSL